MQNGNSHQIPNQASYYDYHHNHHGQQAAPLQNHGYPVNGGQQWGNTPNYGQNQIQMQGYPNQMGQEDYQRQDQDYQQGHYAQNTQQHYQGDSGNGNQDTSQQDIQGQYNNLNQMYHQQNEYPGGAANIMRKQDMRFDGAQDGQEGNYNSHQQYQDSNTYNQGYQNRYQAEQNTENFQKRSNGSATQVRQGYNAHPSYQNQEPGQQGYYQHNESYAQQQNQNSQNEHIYNNQVPLEGQNSQQPYTNYAQNGNQPEYKQNGNSAMYHSYQQPPQTNSQAANMTSTPIKMNQMEPDFPQEDYQQFNQSQSNAYQNQNMQSMSKQRNLSNQGNQPSQHSNQLYNNMSNNANENRHPGMQGYDYSNQVQSHNGQNDYQMNVGLGGIPYHIAQHYADNPDQYPPMHPSFMLPLPKSKPQFRYGDEGEEPIPMEPNLEKVYKEQYIPNDPNRPKTPLPEISDTDSEYRIELDEKKLEEIKHQIEEKIKAKHEKEDSQAEKEKQEEAKKTEEADKSESKKSENKEKEIQIDLNLSDIRSLDSLNSGDMVDLITKNRVKLSINPLEKVKTNQKGEVQKNFISAEQIDIINNPHVLFRIFSEEGKKEWDKTHNREKTMDEYINDLKCFNEDCKSKKSSTDISGYSEISQSQFVDVSIDDSQANQLEILEQDELAEDISTQKTITKQSKEANEGEIIPSNDQSQCTESKQIPSKDQAPIQNQQNFENDNIQPQSQIQDKQPQVQVQPAVAPNPVIQPPIGDENEIQNNLPQVQPPVASKFVIQPQISNEPIYPYKQAANHNSNQNLAYPPQQNFHNSDGIGQTLQPAVTPFNNQVYYGDERFPEHQYYENVQGYDHHYGYDYMNGQGNYQNYGQTYHNPAYPAYHNQPPQPTSGANLPQNSMINQIHEVPPSGLNMTGPNHLGQPKNPYPPMQDDEMKEFLAMYPYMSDYPIEEIHRFWYNNIKNENLSDVSLEMNSEDFEKIHGIDHNLLDESRNSDQIKQEMRRKRKRPTKKKNQRKNTGDYNNMLDDISEFSRTTYKKIIPRSEIEKDRSRRSSIISLQKSVPENVLLKYTAEVVRSEASGSRGPSPQPRMIHKQLTDKKVKASHESLKENIQNQSKEPKKNIQGFNIDQKEQKPSEYTPLNPKLPIAENNKIPQNGVQSKIQPPQAPQIQTSIQPITNNAAAPQMPNGNMNQNQNQYQQPQYTGYHEQEYHSFHHSQQPVNDSQAQYNQPSPHPIQHQSGYYPYQGGGYYYNDPNASIQETDPYLYHHNSQEHYYHNYPLPNTQYNAQGYNRGYNQPSTPQPYPDQSNPQNQVYNNSILPPQSQNHTHLSNPNSNFQDHSYNHQPGYDQRKSPMNPNELNLPNPCFQNQQYYNQQQSQDNATTHLNNINNNTNQQLSQNNSQQNFNGMNINPAPTQNNQPLSTANRPSVSHQVQNYGNQSSPNQVNNNGVSHQDNFSNHRLQDGTIGQRMDHQPSNFNQLDDTQGRRMGNNLPIPVSNTVIPTNIRSNNNQIPINYVPENMNPPALPQTHPVDLETVDIQNSTNPQTTQLQGILQGGSETGQTIHNNANSQEKIQRKALNVSQNQIDTSELSLLDQCRHRNHTGRLQRKLREMNDNQRLEIFRELKPQFLDVCCDPYGKYVATLFLGFNLSPINDATISFFDKHMKILVRNEYAIKFCQKLIETKFKDKRLRRSLNKIFEEMEYFVLDKTSALCVLSYVNQANSSDLKQLAEFCKLHISECIENEVMAKIISKLIKKVAKSLSSELVLFLRKVVIQLIEKKKGKELVEVFFDYATREDRVVVIEYIIGQAHDLVSEIETQYLFYKMVDLQLAEAIDKVLESVLRDSDKPNNFSGLVNKCVSSRNLQILFLKASKQYKDKLRDRLATFIASGQELSDSGKQFQELINRYFNN